MTDFISGKLEKSVTQEGLDFSDVEEGLPFQGNDLENVAEGLSLQNENAENGDIKSPLQTPTKSLQFSPEATAVFEAGRELWRYYHNHGHTVVTSTYNPNASLYDIREYFQGRNESGKMNNKSEDPEYTRLIANLRDNLKVLAAKIQPKVYEYGFLRG